MFYIIRVTVVPHTDVHTVMFYTAFLSVINYKSNWLVLRIIQAVFCVYSVRSWVQTLLSFHTSHTKTGLYFFLFKTLKPDKHFCYSLSLKCSSSHEGVFNFYSTNIKKKCYSTHSLQTTYLHYCFLRLLYTYSLNSGAEYFEADELNFPVSV